MARVPYAAQPTFVSTALRLEPVVPEALLAIRPWVTIAPESTCGTRDGLSQTLPL